MAEFEFSYKFPGSADFLYYDGPVIEVSISAPVPLLAYLSDNDLPAFPVVSGLAIIDTGASMSVVDSSVVEELDIPYLDTIPTGTIHGTADTKRYNVSARFPSLHLTDIDVSYAAAGKVRAATFEGRDIIMLLGRDLLRRFTMTYDGPNAKVRIAT